MKLRYLIFTFVAFIIAVAAGASWFFLSLSAASPTTTTSQDFTILPKEPASDIVAHLQKSGLIKSATAAKLYLRLTEMDSRLAPGVYSVSSSQTTPDLLKSLTRGPKDIWVTIPEGWRREQVAARLEKTLAGDPNFNVQDFLSQTTTLEGRLFPDTYLIPALATTSDVIKVISDNFTSKVSTISSSDLILASLVEREARLAPDRPIIAGIFKKRLESDWPLQVDATIQYAESSHRCQKDLLGCDWWIPPTDTTLASNYNTYTNPGLPPTPICSPGLASIEAVLHPQTTNFWYYLTDDKGVTHFSVTLAEHNLNVDKYLRP